MTSEIEPIIRYLHIPIIKNYQSANPIHFMRIIPLKKFPTKDIFNFWNISQLIDLCNI